jgi:hypothetical protein
MFPQSEIKGKIFIVVWMTKKKKLVILNICSLYELPLPELIIFIAGPVILASSISIPTN